MSKDQARIRYCQHLDMLQMYRRAIVDMDNLNNNTSLNEREKKETK